MRAIGLDRPTRVLTGLHRATTEKDIMQVIGKETTAVLNTTITGIRKMAGTTTTTGNTMVRTTTTTSR